MSTKNNSNNDHHSSIDPNKEKYLDYITIKRHVNWYLQVTDPILRNEFHIFNSLKRSSGFLFVISCLFMIFFPIHIMIFQADINTNITSKYFISRVITSTLAMLSTLVAFSSGWLLFLHHTSFNLYGIQQIFKFRHLFRSSTTSTSEGIDISDIQIESRSCSSNNQIDIEGISTSNTTVGSSNYSFFEKYLCHIHLPFSTFFLNICLVGSIQLFFILLFLRRTLSLNCIANVDIIVRYYGAGICYSNETMPYGILFNAIMMLSVPILLFVNLPDTQITFVWFNYFVSLLLFLVVSINLGYPDVIGKLFMWICICFFTIIDVQTRNILLFFAKRKLAETLEENERMANANHALEMRHMIANLAHDLKTVSELLSLPLFTLYALSKTSTFNFNVVGVCTTYLEPA